MNRYALIVGISQYQNRSLPELSKPAVSAEAVARLLETHGNFQEVRRLPANWLSADRAEVGRTPLTEAELSAEIKRLLNEQAIGGDVLIYFSGHGFVESDKLGGSEAYLAASDTQIGVEAGRVVWQQNGIRLRSLAEQFAQANFSSLVMLLDCCHSGSLIESGVVQQALANASSGDYVLIAACRGFEKAYEGAAETSHSNFTSALLAGLAREQGGKNGLISSDRLFDHLSQTLKGTGQQPIRVGRGRSIAIVNYSLGEPIPAATSFNSASSYTEQAAFKVFLSSFSKFFKNKWLLATLVALVATPLLFIPPLYKILAVFNQCSNDKVNSSISSAERNLDKGNTEAALSQVDRSFQECKDDRLLVTKSQVLIKRNDYEQAIEILQVLLNKKDVASDTTIQARYWLGIALAKSNDWSKALDQFKQVEDNLSLKLKVYYNSGVCNYKLEKWDESIQNLTYVVENLKDRATNTQPENELTQYYPDALFYLIDINAKRWYENRGTSKANGFKKSFLERYYERNRYTTRKNIAQTKVLLDRLASAIRNKSSNSPVYSYIYETKDFKSLVCKMYQDVQQEIPQAFKPFCE